VIHGDLTEGAVELTVEEWVGADEAIDVWGGVEPFSQSDGHCRTPTDTRMAVDSEFGHGIALLQDKVLKGLCLLVSERV
jgi:hypothetical protein